MQVNSRQLSPLSFGLNFWLASLKFSQMLMINPASSGIETYSQLARLQPVKLSQVLA